MILWLWEEFSISIIILRLTFVCNVGYVVHIHPLSCISVCRKILLTYISYFNKIPVIKTLKENLRDSVFYSRFNNKNNCLVGYARYFVLLLNKNLKGGLLILTCTMQPLFNNWDLKIFHHIYRFLRRCEDEGDIIHLQKTSENLVKYYTLQSPCVSYFVYKSFLCCICTKKFI